MNFPASNPKKIHPGTIDPVLARQLSQRPDMQRKPLSKRMPHKPTLWQTLGDHPLVRLFTFAPKAPYHLLVTPPDPWAGSASLGRDILQNRFYFFGQRFSGPTVQWKPDNASPDWLTALHSFEWLRDLRAVGGDQARKTARILVKDWLQHYKRWEPLAWRPDIVGARLSAWIGLHDFFLASADDGYRMDVFESIHKQSRYLLRVLPGHTKGARLITALKGQIYACLALPNSQARLFQALALLQTEITKQILPDGGHIERNPSTHAQVLQHFIDIRAALRSGGLAVPDSVQNAIHAMAPVLRFYCHGDNRLAHFNGANEGEAPLLDLILQQAHTTEKPAASLPHTGYERMQAGRSIVVFDVGTPPQPGYDTHLHAAPLSFEFSNGRERLVVNCGHAGTICRQTPMAMALRNTAAHSTCVVANTNALELRNEGGIGRHPKTIHLHRDTQKDHILVAASHDGYHSNLGIIHTRQLYLTDQGEDLRGHDSFVGSAGHPFAIRMHMHPDLKISMTSDNNGVLLRTRSGAGWRFRANGATVYLEESIYMIQTGDMPKKSTQIVLSGHTTDKEKIVKWSFRREKKARTNAAEKRNKAAAPDKKSDTNAPQLNYME